MPSTLYYVRRGPFQYGNLPAGASYAPDVILDMDQVFELRGYRNDEMLTRLGFVASVSERATLVQCGRCGQRFISDSGLHWHGRRRHEVKAEGSMREVAPGTVNPTMESQHGARPQVLPAHGIDSDADDEGQRLERMLDESRPVFWENTTAARKAGDGPLPVEVATPPTPAPVQAAPAPPQTKTPAPPKRRFVIPKRKAEKEGA